MFRDEFYPFLIAIPVRPSSKLKMGTRASVGSNSSMIKVVIRCNSTNTILVGVSLCLEGFP